MERKLEGLINSITKILTIQIRRKPTMQATTTTTTTTTTNQLAVNDLEPTNRTSPSPSTTPNNNKRKRASFECVICLGDYKSNIPHGTENCNHKACRECVRKYFRSTLRDDRYQSYEHIQCPSHNCSQYFVANDSLRRFFSKNETIKWWDSAIKKTCITNKVTCPLSGCRAIFEVDEKNLKQCTFTVCYECRRGFCSACQKSWHPGEVRIVNDEAELKNTLKEAEKNNWCCCPKCHTIVEKMGGCSTMKCSCGTYFCYRCGGRSDYHYCLNKCQNLSPEGLKAIRSSMFTPKKPRV
ncbi:hypothetical protein EDC94DRAFT_595187 [Helicostylum pulchrum]|nr:hypothetical protein EDC94DRAFT_595187 [Helicostylum pulchrum]